MNNFEIEIEDLKRKIEILESKKSEIPTYSYSKIKFEDLSSLVDIKRDYSVAVFDNWFINSEKLKSSDIEFLQNLIDKISFLIESYKEEDLKVKFISPILNRVDFLILDKEIRDYYDEKLTYKTDTFIFTGATDFLIAKGLEFSQNPYFFIQEFKKSIQGSDPRPQLLAELISAIELNSDTVIKGAYIIGAIWNFVILERLEVGKYRYYISKNFDSTKIEELKSIYKNLLYIKREICEFKI